MRVKELVFHVDCFTCHACNQRFTRGQQLALVDDFIYCTKHYHQLLASAVAAAAATAESPASSSASATADDVAASRNAYYSAPAYSQTGRARKRAAKSQTTDSQTLGRYTDNAAVVRWLQLRFDGRDVRLLVRGH